MYRVGSYRRPGGWESPYPFAVRFFSAYKADGQERKWPDLPGGLVR